QAKRRGGRGGGEAPVEGVRDKVGGQDGGREATDTIRPRELPEGPRAQGRAPGRRLQRSLARASGLRPAVTGGLLVVAIGQESQVAGVVVEEEKGQGQGQHQN